MADKWRSVEDRETVVRPFGERLAEEAVAEREGTGSNGPGAGRVDADVAVD